MTSTSESKQEDCHGSRRCEAEFKQEFLDEYGKKYGDGPISAEQTWEIYQIIDERQHKKMRENFHRLRHRSPSSSSNTTDSSQKHSSRSSSSQSSHSPEKHAKGSPPRRHGSCHRRSNEKRKQLLSELQQDFQKDFTATHDINKINADQAWLLVQKVKQNKREKWQKHGHHYGSKKHKHRHGSKEHKHGHGSKEHKYHHDLKDRKHHCYSKTQEHQSSTDNVET